VLWIDSRYHSDRPVPTSGGAEKERGEIISTYSIGHHLSKFINEYIN
jgi:hypothetical protein